CGRGCVWVEMCIFTLLSAGSSSGLFSFLCLSFPLSSFLSLPLSFIRSLLLLLRPHTIPYISRSLSLIAHAALPSSLSSSLCPPSLSLSLFLSLSLSLSLSLCVCVCVCVCE